MLHIVLQIRYKPHNLFSDHRNYIWLARPKNLVKYLCMNSLDPNHNSAEKGRSQWSSLQWSQWSSLQWSLLQYMANCFSVIRRAREWSSQQPFHCTCTVTPPTASLNVAAIPDHLSVRSLVPDYGQLKERTGTSPSQGKKESGNGKSQSGAVHGKKRHRSEGCQFQRGCLSLADFLSAALSYLHEQLSSSWPAAEPLWGTAGHAKGLCSGRQRSKGAALSLSPAVTPSSRGTAPTVPFQRLTRNLQHKQGLSTELLKLELGT